MEIVQNIYQGILLGMVVGTVYGLIGLGIVLIYKAQKAINFAQAEFATFGAFMLYVLHAQQELPYGLAAVLAVLAVVALSVTVERVVIRPLRNSPDVTLFVATAAVALFIIAATLYFAGANIVLVEPAYFQGEEWFRERGLGLIGPQRLIVLGVLVASAVGLAAFFKKTALGKAVLAMSSEPFALRLAGISDSKMSILVWGLAGLVAGLAGVAFIPTTALFPGLFTREFLIPSLTAVVVGGLTSLPGALVGGIAIGVFAQLFSQMAPATLPGPGIVSSFVILLAVLLFRPQGLLVRGASSG